MQTALFSPSSPLALAGDRQPAATCETQEMSLFSAGFGSRQGSPWGVTQTVDVAGAFLGSEGVSLF